jgi:hypothetical protein
LNRFPVDVKQHGAGRSNRQLSNLRGAHTGPPVEASDEQRGHSDQVPGEFPVLNGDDRAVIEARTCDVSPNPYCFELASAMTRARICSTAVDPTV